MLMLLRLKPYHACAIARLLGGYSLTGCHPLNFVATLKAHNSSDLAEFFAKLPQLDFVSGFATHMAPVPLPSYVEQARAASAKAGRGHPLPVRLYPDICHTVHSARFVWQGNLLKYARILD